MMIVNADDLGRSLTETEAALACYTQGRITSASAMVFMADSERAADLAKGTELDIGLHLNFDETFTAPQVPLELTRQHSSVARFLKHGKYAQLLYNPFLRRKIRSLYRAQSEEFVRLYGRPPSHIDGHRHLHLCTNMLVDKVIPAGLKVRRTFSFFRDEKGRFNRAYRHWVDSCLQGRYLLTDYFFCLGQCLQARTLERAVGLARTANVELMTHPQRAFERSYLSSNAYLEMFRNLKLGSYAEL
jgi:predicted glycoside hydrolase/deacetylase ChbG (UPF0249 family)